MPLIIPPGFCQASFVLSGSVGTAPYVTTLGLDTSDFGGDFVSAANVAMTAYGTAFAPLCNNDLSLDRCTLFIGSDGASGSVDSDIPPIQMTGAGAYAPTAMSVLVRKNTAEFGRRGRGRMFLPGSALESGVDEAGAVIPAFQVNVQDAADVFYEMLAESEDPGGFLPPVLFHASAPADPTPITSFGVAPLVGWVGGRIR